MSKDSTPWNGQETELAPVELTDQDLAEVVGGRPQSLATLPLTPTCD